MSAERRETIAAWDDRSRCRGASGPSARESQERSIERSRLNPPPEQKLQMIYFLPIPGVRSALAVYIGQIFMELSGK